MSQRPCILWEWESPATRALHLFITAPGLLSSKSWYCLNHLTLRISICCHSTNLRCVIAMWLFWCPHARRCREPVVCRMQHWGRMASDMWVNTNPFIYCLPSTVCILEHASMHDWLIVIAWLTIKALASVLCEYIRRIYSAHVWTFLSKQVAMQVTCWTSRR